MKYACEPTEFHEKRVTVRFTTQVIIDREINRHRTHSMAGQSTRYCNYGKEKFGSELSISSPEWVENELDSYDNNIKSYCTEIANNANNVWDAIKYWLFANLSCEFSYLNLLRLGKSIDEARSVLPLDLNSELVHTAFVSD